MRLWGSSPSARSRSGMPSAASPMNQWGTRGCDRGQRLHGSSVRIRWPVVSPSRFLSCHVYAIVRLSAVSESLGILSSAIFRCRMASGSRPRSYSMWPSNE